jgi:hypothetical protein
MRMSTCANKLRLTQGRPARPVHVPVEKRQWNAGELVYSVSHEETRLCRLDETRA